jgi:hypothetical protein
LDGRRYTVFEFDGQIQTEAIVDALFAWLISQQQSASSTFLSEQTSTSQTNMPWMVKNGLFPYWGYTRVLHTANHYYIFYKQTFETTSLSNSQISKCATT